MSAIRNGLWEVPLVRGRRTFHVGRDLTQAVTLVQGALEELREVRAVVIADFGVGQAVTARLLELQRNGKIPTYCVASPHSPLGFRDRGVWIDSCNLEARAWSERRFADTKDELWWNGREAIRQGELALASENEISQWGLPAGQHAIGQLSTPVAGSDHGGRIVVWDEREARGPVDRTRHLSAKSPNLAHSLLLAWHGYARLKELKAFEPPRTTWELFNLRTRERLEREQRLRTRRARANPTPWQRMAR